MVQGSVRERRLCFNKQHATTNLLVNRGIVDRLVNPTRGGVFLHGSMMMRMMMMMMRRMMMMMMKMMRMMRIMEFDLKKGNNKG